MQAINYIQREFEEFTQTTRFDYLAIGTKRIAWRSLRFFDEFMASECPGDDEVREEHVVGYAFHRVLGTLGSSEPARAHNRTFWGFRDQGVGARNRTFSALGIRDL